MMNKVSWKRQRVLPLFLMIVLLLSACAGMADEGGQDLPADYGTPMLPDTASTPLPGEGPAGQGGEAAASAGPISALQMLDYAIVNPEGDSLGAVADLILNAETSQIDYVLLSEDKSQEMVAPIPWLVFAGGGNGQLTLNVERDSVEFASLSDIRDLNLGNPTWDDGYREYWDELMPPEAQEPDSIITGTQATSPHFSLNSLMTGGVDSLVDKSPLGAVQDVIVDPGSGQVLYAVLLTEGNAGQPSQWVPVPIHQLTIAYDNPLAPGGFNILMDPDRLQGAPTWEPGALPDMTGAGWDSDLQAYWGSQP